jgi:hypothetical protein
LSEIDGIQLEHIECLRINHENFSTLFYPQFNSMSVEFFDEEEDDEVEQTVWDEMGFIESKFDNSILQQDLLLFKEYI